MKRLRIAQIGTLFEPITDSSKNGLSQIVHILSENLVDLGHEVTLYAPLRSSTRAKLVALSDMEDAAETILGKVLPIIAAFADWRNFDVIHDHTRFYSTAFAHLLPVPLVSTVHHPIEFDEIHWGHPHDQFKTYFEAIWEHLIQSVTTVFVSHFQRADFKGEARVIHNGIPLDRWANPSFSAGEYLAFFGAINETKGAREAIEAALLANERVVIAGTIYESEEYFERSVRPYIDGDKVKYIGSLNFEEKQKFLAQAKAVLMPIQWNDPLPTVGLESLASGTPIIAWDRSSMGEIVENGQTGFLVSSIQEMASRIKDIGTIDRRKCRSRAEQLFDAKQMAKNYVELYESLLKA
jgi:glycosyltransferase involved in cell wall biosynthesis